MPEIAVTSLPIRLQRQVDQARTAIERDNPEYAISLCQGILETHPGCLAVRRLLRAAQVKRRKSGHALFGRVFGALKGAPALLSARARRQKNPLAALIAAERALGADPTNLAALRVLAEAALAADLPETAVFALENIRERRPNDRGALIRLAEAYVAAGRSADGLAIAEKLLRETPGDAQLQELMKSASVAQSIHAGRWDSGSGTFRDKLRDEQEAVSLEQANKVVRTDAMTQHQIDEAIARLRLEPQSLNLHRTIIQGHQTLGNLDEALEWIARARALPTGAADVALEKLESDLRLARIERRIRERTVALVESHGDLASDPELARLRTELSEARIRDMRAFAEKYPNEPGYKFELGQLYREAGQIDLAIQQFQIAQRHPKLRIAALLQLGACFQAKRLFDLALQQFETARAEIAGFDDQKKEAIYQLGCCLEAMGQGERAVEEFKQIYSVDIGFRDVAAKIDRFYARS